MAAARSAANAFAPTGAVLFGPGEKQVHVTWKLMDTTGYDTHRQMGDTGAGVFAVFKAKRAAGFPSGGRFFWIQWTEALLEGKVYTPPGAKWPWVGIDRYPNMERRTDALPYMFLPEEQERCNIGEVYGGRVRIFYSPGDADSVAADWAGARLANWGHRSTIAPVWQFEGKDYRLGNISWHWSTDFTGRVKDFGARVSTPEEATPWHGSLASNYRDYLANTYAGDMV